MAASISYFATAKMGHARVTTGVAATDGSGSSTAITWYNTAPASDWMLTKIVITATNATGTANSADALFNIFVSDGTTKRLIRSIDVGDPAVGTTTTSAGVWEVNFGPEFVFPSTVLPEVAVSATPTAGNVDFVVFAQAA